MNLWTMEPPDVTKIKKQPAHEQVIEQIRSIYGTIDNDLLSSIQNDTDTILTTKNFAAKI